MLWPTAEFLAFLEEEIETLIRNKEAVGEHNAFLLWVLRNYYGLDEIASQKAAVASRRGDSGVDAFFEKDGRLFIVQAKTEDPITEHSIFPDEAVRDLTNALQTLRNPDKAPDPSTKTMCLEYAKAIERGCSVEFVALVSGQSGKAIERAVDRQNSEFEKDRKQYKGHHISVIQQKDLNKRFVQTLSGKSVGSVELEMGLSEPAMRYHYFDSSRTALVVDSDLLTIGKWIEAHEYGIIAKNLRYPLGDTKYNEGILETLGDDDERNHFWFYNNGMTIVCDKIENLPARGGGFKLRLTNPQIVNGGQTAFTIRRFLKDNPNKSGALEQTRILLRIIQARKDAEGKPIGPTIDKIAQYTNSQNAIGDRDLRANDEVQVVLQHKFEEWNWFYERKNGEWKALKGPGARARAGFKRGKLDNTALAQLGLAFWFEKPQEAKNQRRLLFVRGKNGYYSGIFKPEQPTLINAEDLLLPHLTFALLDYWAWDWLKRHPLTERSHPSTIRKVGTVKDGDFYLLALTSRLLKKKYGVAFLAGAGGKPHAELRHLVETADASFRRLDRDDKADAFSRALFSAWNEMVEASDPYLEKLMKTDPNLTPRKIFVRSSTFVDRAYQRPFGPAWIKAQAKGLPDL